MNSEAQWAPSPEPLQRGKEEREMGSTKHDFPKETLSCLLRTINPGPCRRPLVEDLKRSEFHCLSPGEPALSLLPDSRRQGLAAQPQGT